MKKLFLFSFLLIAIAYAAEKVKNPIVGCYLNVSARRTGDGIFSIRDHIDPNLCTHLYYGSFGVKEDGTVISLNEQFDSPNSKTYGGIYDAIQLKKVNKDLKLILSIGGPQVPGERFSSIAASFEKRQKLVDSAMFLVENRLNGFDGVDINWQFPSVSDRANYKQLLREMNGSLKEKKKILTVTVAANSFTHGAESPSYSSVQTDTHADIINIMSYDYASLSDTTTSHNAPLYGKKQKDVDWSTGTWTSATNVVVGLPLHGRSFTLVDVTRNQIGAPVTGPGKPGPYRQEAGVLSYNEICENLKNGWTRVWDAQAMAPYAFKDYQWVSYDDLESLSKKIEYIKNKSYDLVGVYVYALDEDDFRGKCGPKNPLLTYIYNSFYPKKSALGSIKDIFG